MHYYDDDYEDCCWHENAEVDVVDGILRCYECGHSRLATTVEIDAEYRWIAEYDEYVEREMNGPRFSLSAIYWRVRQAIHTFFFRRKHQFLSDDEIPF